MSTISNRMTAGPGLPKASTVLVYLVLIVVALCFLVPFLIMVNTSVKTLADIRSGTLVSLPVEVTLEPWLKAWGRLRGHFWNSVRMVIPAVAISTMIGAINGYVFSKWRFPGSEAFFTALVEMAKIDGAGFFRIFWRILIPISAPIFVVAIIWQTTQIWNDFLFGVSSSGSASQPITVALNNLVNTSTGVKEYNVDMAGAIIAGFPTLIVYVVSGRYFLRGLTAGSLAGQ
ncbi:MAG: carbohydrate ABC transporter permease [Spirochaetaceae bacterium]